MRKAYESLAQKCRAFLIAKRVCCRTRYAYTAEGWESGELLMIDILWAVFKYCLLIVIVGIIIAITVAALCAIAAMIKLAIGAVISFFREV